MLFVCVYLCRCSEEAASRCHRLGNERGGNNLAHRQQEQGWKERKTEREDGKRGSKKGLDRQKRESKTRFLTFCLRICIVFSSTPDNTQLWVSYA